jgi:S1-C subfamily serine protease
VAKYLQRSCAKCNGYLGIVVPERKAKPPVQAIKRGFWTLLLSTLLSCTTAPSSGVKSIETPDGWQLSDKFKDGEVRLDCRVACSGTYGWNRPNLRKLHDSDKWEELAITVLRIGFVNDQSYYYLARAAEGFGFYDAAEEYYRLGLAVPFAETCRGGMINVCDGFVFPREIVMRRETIKPRISRTTREPEAPKDRREKRPGSGTGFFVTDDGYFVTTYHVIEGAKEITVKTTDGRLLAARFISGDSANDVALLKIESATKAARISDTGELLRGEEVFTLGFPLLEIQGQDQKATFGRVNALSGIGGDIRLVQIDIPIQPGNSGGPLIDSKGQVVGVVTATLNQLVTLRATGSLPQNVNYAVKSDYLIPLLHNSLKDKWRKIGSIQKSRSMAELVKELESSVVLVIAR